MKTAKLERTSDPITSRGLPWRSRGVAIWLGLILLLSAGAAFGKPMKRQSNWGQNDGTGSVRCAWSSKVVAGDLVIAAVTYTGGTGTTITPDSSHGAWTLISSGAANNGTSVGVALYYRQNTAAISTAGTVETWTVSPTSAEVVLQLHEFTGVVASGALDADGVATGSSSPAVVTTAGMPTDLTSEMSFTAFAVLSASSTLGTPSPSFSNATSTGTGGLSNTATPTTASTKSRNAYALLTSSASSQVSASMTETGPTVAWAGAVATFKLTAVYWIGAGSYPARPLIPDGTVCYGHFDDDGCWSSASGGAGNVLSPGPNDVVVFDGGGTGDVSFNPLVGGTESAYSIDVQAGYTGTMSVTDRLTDIPDLTTSGRFQMASGTVNLNSAQVTLGTAVASGQDSFRMTGGTFNAGTGTVTVTRNTTLNGGGSTFNGGSATETFNAALSVTSGAATLGPSAVLTGVTSVGTILSAATNGSLTLTSGNVTIPTTLNVYGASSVFDAGSATLTVAGQTNVDYGGTFKAGSGTKTFTGRLVLGTTSTLTAGTFKLNTATALFNSSSSVLLKGGSTFDGSAGGSVTFGANVGTGSNAIDLTNGTMNLSGASTTIGGLGNVSITTGTMTMGPGSVTMPGNLTVNGTFDANVATGVTVDGALSMAAGTFHAKSTTLDVKGTTSLTSTSVFDSVAATVTFENNLSLANSASMDLSGATLVMPAGTVTVPSGTSLTLGAHGTTFPSTVNVGGTFAGGAGALSFAGLVTNTGGSLNLASPSGLTFTGGLTVSGGTTTWGAQTIAATTLSVVSGTLNAGTASLTVSGATTVSGGVANFATTTAGPTLTGLVTVSGGTVSFGSGTTAMQNNLVMSGGTLNAGGTTQLTGSLGMTGGNFNADSTRLTVGGNTTIAGISAATGAAFNSNTANITFSGQVAVGGADGTLGTFRCNDATLSFEFPTNMVAPDSVILQGPAASSFSVSSTPTITFGKNAVAGTNAVHVISGTMSVNSNANVIFNPSGGAGNVTVEAAGSLSLSSVAATFPQALTVAGTLTGGGGALTFSGPVSVSGTFTGGANASRVFASTLSVSGTYTASSGGYIFSGAVTNSAGALNLSAAASLTFNTGSSLTVSGGTTTTGSYGGAVTTLPSLAVSGGSFSIGSGNNNTRLTVSGNTDVSGGTVTLGGNRSVTLSGPVTVSGTGSVTLGAAAESLGSTLAVSGGSFAAGTGNVTIAGAVTVSGGAVTMGSGTEALATTLDVTGGSFTGGSGPVTVTGAATVSGGGSINGGASSSFKLSSTLAIGNNGTGGTFNAGAATVTFSGVVTLQSSGAFNGNTGSGSFSLAPVLTSGVFTVGDASSTGRWTLTQSTTFSSGVTLAFPTDKGELSLSPTKTLTLNGPVTSNVGASSTLPKIDCNGCTAVQGITVAFGATSTLNINGLELDNSVGTGVSIANGATYTLLKRLKFIANRGGAGSTHLVINLGSGFVNAPGCYFDASALHNVTLYGVMTAPAGARATFEDQSAAVNGSGAGPTLDQDGDSDGDNVGDNTSTGPYYGSVVQWVNASPTDTSGSAVGFPTAAFDWNTFSYYGVYASFKDTTGAGTADVLWRRNDDGSPAYSFSIPQSSGDLLGTPYWDSVNEVTAGFDVNGNGNQTDTDVRIVYLGTSLGHVVKLVDTGAALVRPTSGPWSSDFTSGGVATISSPLTKDATNLYFGGTDGTAAPNVFGVQIAGGANEKTLQKAVPSLGLVTTTPAWSYYSGSTEIFAGSAATAGQAYAYRMNMGSKLVDGSFSGSTSAFNGAAVLIKSRAYLVTDGGALHALDAFNFGVGAFTNVGGFPYQSAAAKPIKSAPWVDSSTGTAYFGDDGGNLYAVTTSGANQTGYPLSISSGITLSSTPIYRHGGGVIGIGGSDGYVYFVDRRNGSGVPAVFKRFAVTASGSISSVAYDANISSYLVSSSDGKLVFVNAADVADPTPGTE